MLVGKIKGALGFSVLRFRHRFAAFVPMHSGFSALVFVSVCGFSVFQHLIFDFHQKYSRVFGFGV